MLSFIEFKSILFVQLPQFSYVVSKVMRVMGFLSLYINNYAIAVFVGIRKAAITNLPFRKQREDVGFDYEVV